MENEIEKIVALTGVSCADIKIHDDGFWSRGYVIDNGRIVFKFKKADTVSYREEIRMLDFVNSLGLGVNLQRVGWTTPDDAYLGLYGVVGKSIETTDYDTESVGRQLGQCLQQLHQAQMEGAESLSLSAEVAAWQQRFDSENTQAALNEHFAKSEIEMLEHYMRDEVPKRLGDLGEKLVLSHGDLGDGNIFVDEYGKVGVIDFNECCYLDEAADFMDVSSDELCEKILESYGADNTLHEKVRVRRQLRPLIVLGSYAGRGDNEKVAQLVQQIRNNIINK